MQFGLKALLALVTAVSVLLGLSLRASVRQRIAVRKLRESGAEVFYDFEEFPAGSGRFRSGRSPRVPGWLLKHLGHDYFCSVVYVAIESPGDRQLSSTASRAELAGALGDLKMLRSLFINGELATDDVLAALSKLTRLKELVLTDAHNVTDSGIVPLKWLSGLRLLVLTDSAVSDESLLAIGRLPLKKLVLEGAYFSDAAIAHLRGCRELTTLHLSRIRAAAAGGDGWSFLADLQELDDLSICESSLSAGAVRPLGRLRQLRTLDLSDNPHIGDDGIAYLECLEHLVDLNLRNTNLTSRGVGHLSSSTNLRRLNLSQNTGVTDAAADILSAFRHLERLNLSGTGICDATINQLQSLGKICVLDVSENGCLTNASASCLSRLETLVDLDVHNTRIFSPGVDVTEGVMRLKTLKRLKYLDVAGTGVSVRALSQMLPSCSIVGSNARGMHRLGASTGRDLSSITGQLIHWSVAEHTHAEIADASLVSTKLMRRTVKRMIAVSRVSYLAPEFAMQRSAIERFGGRLDASPSARSAEVRDVTELQELARHNDWIAHLYAASSYLEIADALADYVAYLDKVQITWALTDVEQDEQRQAAADMLTCLRHAAEHLGVEMPSSLDGHASPMVTLWQDTRPIDANEGRK